MRCISGGALGLGCCGQCVRLFIAGFPTDASRTSSVDRLNLCTNCGRNTFEVIFAQFT
jgi:hypothetical protein